MDFDTSTIPDCQDPSFLSCQSAKINFDALLSGEDLDFFDGHEMKRTQETEATMGNMTNFVYKVRVLSQEPWSFLIQLSPIPFEERVVFRLARFDLLFNSS